MPYPARTPQAKLCLVKTLELVSALLRRIQARSIDDPESLDDIGRTLAYSVGEMDTVFERFKSDVVWPESWMYKNLIDPMSPHYVKDFHQMTDGSLELS